MASQMSGVSLRARRGSTQVMLGCHCGPDGTRTRWDTSLIIITTTVITVIITIIRSIIHSDATKILYVYAKYDM